MRSDGTPRGRARRHQMTRELRRRNRSDVPVALGEPAAEHPGRSVPPVYRREGSIASPSQLRCKATLGAKCAHAYRVLSEPLVTVSSLSLGRWDRLWRRRGVEQQWPTAMMRSNDIGSQRQWGIGGRGGAEPDRGAEAGTQADDAAGVVGSGRGSAVAWWLRSGGSGRGGSGAVLRTRCPMRRDRLPMRPRPPPTPA